MSEDKRNFIKNINFNDKKYKLCKFKYFSGRLGLLLTQVDDFNMYLSGTVDIPGIVIHDNEVIVKSHDFNSGLLECLIENEIVNKQAKAITLGWNKVYLCKLI